MRISEMMRDLRVKDLAFAIAGIFLDLLVITIPLLNLL